MGLKKGERCLPRCGRDLEFDADSIVRFRMVGVGDRGIRRRKQLDTGALLGLVDVNRLVLVLDLSEDGAVEYRSRSFFKPDDSLIGVVVPKLLIRCLVVPKLLVRCLAVSLLKSGECLVREFVLKEELLCVRRDAVMLRCGAFLDTEYAGYSRLMHLPDLDVVIVTRKSWMCLGRVVRRRSDRSDKILDCKMRT